MFTFGVDEKEMLIAVEVPCNLGDTKSQGYVLRVVTLP